MRLTVLGGSAAGPNPGQGCSGYLIESGTTRVVIDLGSGTFPELRRHVDYRRIDAVVFSHVHLDHVLDLLALRYTLAYNPIPSERPLPIWLPPKGRVFLQRLAGALADPPESNNYFSVFDAREYDPDAVLSIGDLQLRFRSTVHYIPCWATRISNGVDGDLVYTADTGPSADLAPFAKGAHVMIAEGTERRLSSEPFATRGHLTPAEAGSLAREAGIEILVLSHLWAEDDPFAAIQEAGQAFGGPVELAVPGLHVRWSQNDI